MNVKRIRVNRNTKKLSFGGSLLLNAVGLTVVVLPLAVWVPPVRAWQAASLLEFDAASVKPSDPDSRNGTVVNVTPGGALHVVNATLKDLIQTAYDVRSFQIEGGPRWTDAAKYDIEATPGPRPRNASAAQGWTDVRLEFQALLKERFHLQLHRETRIAPVYSIVISKGGVKASGLSATQSPHRGINAGQAAMQGEAASMQDLASKLSRLLGRPVVNNTNVKGNYDFKLEWTPDSGPAAPGGPPAETTPGPSLFSAIQEQLGLRLEAAKGPVEMLVIRDAKKPSQN
jgi:uncharacterized protein (TIGR03435 family)